MNPSRRIVAKELGHLLLLTLFLSVTPYPRRQLYEESLVITATYGIAALIIIARVLHPVLNLLKIDTQSKAVSGAIALSTVAPRVGDYVLSHRIGIWRLKHAFDNNVGEEMIAFRRDLRRMYVMNSEVAEGSPGKGELLADIKRTHSKVRRRHAIGEVFIGVVVGVVALLVGQISFLGGVGLLLTLYLLIFPLSMALRSIVVDTLAYPVAMVDVENESIQRPPRTATLGFMQGWNRMLLKNEAIIHKLILVSFIKGEFVLGYERGEELIESVLTGELELEEAFDRLVHEELGEETFEGRWVRHLFKRFLGV